MNDEEYQKKAKLISSIFKNDEELYQMNDNDYQKKVKLIPLLVKNDKEAVTYIIDNFDESSSEVTVLLPQLLSSYILNDYDCDLEINKLLDCELTNKIALCLNIIKNHYNQEDKNYTDDEYITKSVNYLLQYKEKKKTREYYILKAIAYHLK